MRASFFAIVSAGLLVAQEPYASLSSEVQDITGAVVPYARVELSLAGSDASSVQHADKEGRFRFSWLPVGTYRLTVTVPGFEEFRLKSIQVAQGQQKLLPPVTLDLSSFCGDRPIHESYGLLPAADHPGNLSGHVRLIDDGPPIADVKVTLLCGERRICGETKTDSAGEFIFFNLRPGEYALRATHSGYYPLEVQNYEVREAFEQTYQPLQLEHCPKGNCDPKLRPKRPLIVCE